MNSKTRTAHRREERDGPYEALVDAVQAVFRALARVLIDQGITSPEAESLLRAVCVHQAADAQAALGKRPNASRIAFVTGLGRKEVSRLLRYPPRVDPALEGRSHCANKVLAGWYTDRAFARNHRPLVLPIRGTTRKRPSFWMLAKRYAPDVYPGLILRELSRVGVLERLQDGGVRPRMRRYGVKSRARLDLRDSERSAPIRIHLKRTQPVRRAESRRNIS
jgi:hypothetical protein